MDVAQSEFLALLLEESLSQHRPAAGNAPRSGPGLVTWQSCDLLVDGQQQQPVPVEGGAVVGCQRERMESAKELTFDPLNPMSFLNADLTNVTDTVNTANANDTNTNADTNTVELGGGSLFDSMLDTILGSSAKEIMGGSASETPSNSPSPSPSPPLVTSCEVAASVDGSTVLVDDLFEADLEKLLHPFAESILNPAGGDLDTWDIESMLTAA